MDRKWPDSAKKTFHSLLDSAETVVQVTPGDYAGWKMMKRDEYIVDNCDVLLALYDGLPNGGTAHTVEYAKAHDKKVVVINPRQFWKDK
jgi:uncharacterized phage-like protein YoqJ